MQVSRLRPCEAFKQTGRELSFNKLCLTLVFFHLHAGIQVPLKMEPAKTTSSNHLRNGKSSFSYQSLMVICGLEFRELFYLHADMQLSLSVYPLFGSSMPAWF